MFGIGPTELIVAGVIGILLFGKRLPSVAKSVGQSIKEFQNSLKGDE